MTKNTLAQMIDGRMTHTIGPDDTIRNACITMTSANVGALPVVRLDGQLLGILSERDVIKRCVIVARSPEDTKVRQVMTTDPKWLPPEARPDEALQLMLKGRFRHLPVCDEGKVSGVVSIRDFSPKSSSLLDRFRGKSGAARD
ncbi:MAG: CBS domain-containing protein [Pseudomonadota bacterium]